MKTIKIVSIVVGVLLILGILLSILYCFYAAPYSKNNDFFDITKKDIKEDITVMSFNIRYFAHDDFFKKSWFYRAQLVLNNIKKEEPDVIGFQEVQPIHEKFLRQHLLGYEFVIAYRTNLDPKEGMLLAYRKDRELPLPVRQFIKDLKLQSRKINESHCSRDGNTVPS